jgi:hypothetical protein
MNAAKQGRVLVAAEIDAHLFSKREEDAREIIRGINFFRGFRALVIGHGPADVGMIGDAPDLLRNFARRKRRINKAGANCATRHRAKFRALFTLRESQSAGRLDRAQARRAIGAAAR